MIRAGPPTSGLHNSWPAEHVLSAAAATGTYVAVAWGNQVKLLELNPAFGKLNELECLSYAEQVSTVALCELSGDNLQVGQLWLYPYAV